MSGERADVAPVIGTVKIDVGCEESLVAKFAKKHATPRKAIPPDNSTPAEPLQFLLEHSGKTAADLLPVFRQRSHVNAALSGKRPISSTQARKLGQMFHMNPGLFL